MNPNLTPVLALMAPEGLFFLKILGVFGLLVMIPLGMLLWKKGDQWFGRCGDVPNETSGSLGYGRAQSWLVYIGAVHLFLWMALGL